MSNFNLYTALLPCFDCRQQKAEASLGWLTPAMHEAVLAQVNTIITASNDYPDDLVTTVTCSVDEAKYYLLLNAFAYSEEEMQTTGVDPDDLVEIEKEIKANKNADGMIELEHDIALQGCTACSPDA